jgi:hypothetical protein
VCVRRLGDPATGDARAARGAVAFDWLSPAGAGWWWSDVGRGERDRRLLELGNMLTDPYRSTDQSELGKLTPVEIELAFSAPPCLEDDEPSVSTNGETPSTSAI